MIVHFVAPRMQQAGEELGSKQQLLQVSMSDLQFCQEQGLHYFGSKQWDR